MRSLGSNEITGLEQTASGIAALFHRETSELTNPAELEEPLSISRYMPGNKGSHSYRLRDRSLARSGRRQLVSSLSNERAGDLQLSHVTERFGMDIEVLDPKDELYGFGKVHAGRMRLTEADHGCSVDVLAGQGVVHRSTPGTLACTADGTTRTNIWVTARRFEAALTSSFKEPPRERLVFVPRIDWTTDSAASLGRLIAHIEAEFTRGADGMAGNPIALSAFTDLFVQAALAALPHNQTDRLARLRDGPVPRHVRLAEDFFRAHAHEPVLMQDAAAVAGCSVRALQLAFRQFRDLSPHAALTNARFEQARAALLRDDAPLREIAHRFGFAHAGRFAAAYTRRFGEAPSQSRRR